MTFTDKHRITHSVEPRGRVIPQMHQHLRFYTSMCTVGERRQHVVREDCLEDGVVDCMACLTSVNKEGERQP